MYPSFPSLQPFQSPVLLVSGEVRSFPLSSASSTDFPGACPTLPVPGARKGPPRAVCLLHKADFCGSSGPVWVVRGPQTQLPLGGGGEAHARSRIWPGSWHFAILFLLHRPGSSAGTGTLGKRLKGLEHFKNKHRVLGLGFEIELRSRGKI